MTRDPDDEGLNWGDETDSSHVGARPRLDGETPPEPAAAPTASSVLLIAYGVFGGAYLLFIVGWIIAVQRDTFVQGSLFAEIMYQFGEFLAIASPAIWFGAVFLLTRSSKPVMRILWLVVGLLITAPWPFILGGFA